MERRQTMPILANVLLAGRGEQLTITATDLEVELVAKANVNVADSRGRSRCPAESCWTSSGRCPEKAQVTISVEGETCHRSSAGKSRFTLATLPATRLSDCRRHSSPADTAHLSSRAARLLDKTHFSMAQQDVRYYLNGMLLEIDGKMLRAVATDGHRLALCETELEHEAKRDQQVIVPRKGVLELQRVLGGEGNVEFAIGTNHVRAQIGDIRFTSKLIDGRFPEYGRVIPANPDQTDRCGSRCAALGPAADCHSFEREISRNSLAVRSQMLWSCRRITPSRKRPRRS